MYYTKEQIQSANHSDIADFLYANGEKLSKRGHQLLWEKNQVWVDGCRWYSHYDTKGGYAIAFVMRYFNQTFH